MDKIDALAYVEANLKQDVAEVVKHAEQEASAVQLLHLQNLRGEVAAHADLLLSIDWACGLAETCTVPEGFAEWSGGQPFGYYETLLEALDALPGKAALSPALLTYLEELPARRQQAYDAQAHFMRTDAEILSIWPDNSMTRLTAQQVGQRSMAIITQHLEATAFFQTYADDLARLRVLAEQRGNWVAIRECLA